MTTESSREPLLGRETARRFAVAVRTFASSEVGGRAFGLGALLLGLLLGINALNVLNSYVSRFFMTAIERREWSQFVRMAILYVGVFLALTATAVIYRFVEERLGLLWREWLTRRLVTAYVGERLYYRLSAVATLTNPDQRIAEDVRSFTTSTLSFALVFLNGTLTILAFSGVLWTISPWLFATAVAYAAIGSLLAIRLGRPLVRLNYDQSDKEANLRSQLIHVRENAESVALLGRETYLVGRLRRHVDALCGNLKTIIAVNRNLGFFTTGYDYLVQVIPVLIVAPLFIRGEVEFGTIPQSSMAFAHLLGAFSLVVKQFPQLSTYAAVLARLSDFAGAAEAASGTVRKAGEPGSEIALDDEGPDRLGVEHLTLNEAGAGTAIIRDLSLEIAPGSRLLVATSSEIQTAALQRAIAGLWESGRGRVVRPPNDRVFFLPDRPYLPPGTLRDLLADGRRPEPTDAQLREVLETFGLAEAVRRVGGLDAERDWDAVLSLEEQRLLVLARILLAEPRFAVLARLDASLGPRRTAWTVDLFSKRGIGCIVVTDGTAPREAFDAVVEIRPDGGWTSTGIVTGADGVEEER